MASTKSSVPPPSTRAPVTSLSKTTIGLKFMARKAEEEHRKKLREEEAKRITDSHWVLATPSGEDSFAHVNLDSEYPEEDDANEDDDDNNDGIVLNRHTQKYLTGRRSFGNFNPKIERAFDMAQRNKRSREMDEKDKKHNVSDEEMANRFSSLVKGTSRYHAGGAQGGSRKDHKKRKNGDEPKGGNVVMKKRRT